MSCQWTRALGFSRRTIRNSRRRRSLRRETNRWIAGLNLWSVLKVSLPLFWQSRLLDHRTHFSLFGRGEDQLLLIGIGVPLPGSSHKHETRFQWTIRCRSWQSFLACVAWSSSLQQIGLGFVGIPSPLHNWGIWNLGSGLGFLDSSSALHIQNGCLTIHLSSRRSVGLGNHDAPGRHGSQ